MPICPECRDAGVHYGASAEEVEKHRRDVHGYNFRGNRQRGGKVTIKKRDEAVVDWQAVSYRERKGMM